MAETSQFQIPMLAAAQAQKHVTVNEALAILDCVTQLRFLSATTATPPMINVDGDAYVVPTGATDDWLGKDGLLAIYVGGFWRYLTPKAGWQAFNVETGTNQLFDGTEWLESTLAATPNGSATEYQIVEVDHVLAPGAASVTLDIIPAYSQVIGVSGRVTSQIVGPLTSWELGVAGALNRYGSGLGLALNSYVLGMSGTPTTYYADTPLQLTSVGGDFGGGTVRLAVHYVTIVPPRAI